MTKIEYATYIKASCDEVYRHLATAEGLDAWFTTGAEVEAVVGGKLHWRWQNFGARRETAEDVGVVLEAEVGRKWAFTWRPGETETTVIIELSPHGQGCMVQLCESGYSESAKDLQMQLYCASGWGEALTLLKFYLEHGITYGDVPVET